MKRKLSRKKAKRTLDVSIENLIKKYVRYMVKKIAKARFTNKSLNLIENLIGMLINISYSNRIK